MTSKKRFGLLGGMGLLVPIFAASLHQSWGDDSSPGLVKDASEEVQPIGWLQLNQMDSRARAQFVEQMSLVEKEKLRKKWDHFKGLDQQAKTKNRELYRQVVDHPESERLHQVMVRYHEWLGGLRSSQRADLLSLEPKERIKRIQLLMKEQEVRKFTELLEKELPAEDLRSISSWVEAFIADFGKELASREEEVIGSLEPDQQGFLRNIQNPAQRQRILAMGALFVSRPDEEQSSTQSRPSAEDFRKLRDGLSPHGQELFDQAEGLGEQRKLVRQWTRAAMMSRRKSLPSVSDETLAAFRRGELEFKLKAEDHDRLERLSGERLKQQLKWYYYRYRGDLEPGSQYRAGGRGGRAGGGRRGSGRPGGGRPRPLEREENRFIDRGVPPFRSP